MTRLLLALPFALALLGPAAADDLKIDNIRAAYTPLGPDRAEQRSVTVYPGEELFFRYRISGASADEQGVVNCTLRLKILGAADKVLLDDSNTVRGVLHLGGGSFAGIARVQIGDNIAPGKYKVSVALHDAVQKKEAEFTREITVKKVDAFAVINPRFTYDALGRTPAPPSGVVDQKLFYRVQLVGFDRTTKKIKVRMEMQILDRDGKEQLAKPIAGHAATEDAKQVEMATTVTFNGELILNRPGEFTVRFKFFDELGNKEAKFEVPLKVGE